MYNKLCNVCDYLRDNAKETIKVIICLTLIPVLIKAYGYIQNDHVVATVYEVTENEVTFEREDGNLYNYLLSESDLTKFNVGDKYQIDMFDFENGNPYDDVIVKINHKLD